MTTSSARKKPTKAWEFSWDEPAPAAGPAKAPPSPVRGKSDIRGPAPKPNVRSDTAANDAGQGSAQPKSSRSQEKMRPSADTGVVLDFRRAPQAQPKPHQPLATQAPTSEPVRTALAQADARKKLKAWEFEWPDEAAAPIAHAKAPEASPEQNDKAVHRGRSKPATRRSPSSTVAEVASTAVEADGPNQPIVGEPTATEAVAASAPYVAAELPVTVVPPVAEVPFLQPPAKASNVRQTAVRSSARRRRPETTLPLLDAAAAAPASIEAGDHAEEASTPQPAAKGIAPADAPPPEIAADAAPLAALPPVEASMAEETASASSAAEAAVEDAVQAIPTADKEPSVSGRQAEVDAIPQDAVDPISHPVPVLAEQPDVVAPRAATSGATRGAARVAKNSVPEPVAPMPSAPAPMVAAQAFPEVLSSPAEPTPAVSAADEGFDEAAFRRKLMTSWSGPTARERAPRVEDVFGPRKSPQPEGVFQQEAAAETPDSLLGVAMAAVSGTQQAGRTRLERETVTATAKGGRRREVEVVKLHRADAPRRTLSLGANGAQQEAADRTPPTPIPGRLSLMGRSPETLSIQREEADERRASRMAETSARMQAEAVTSGQAAATTPKERIARDPLVRTAVQIASMMQTSNDQPGAVQRIKELIRDLRRSVSDLEVRFQSNRSMEQGAF